MSDFLKLVLLLGVCQPSFAQEGDWSPLAEGWEFYRGDLGGPWEALRSDVKGDALAWAPVTTPHCYNAFDGVDPDRAYYQGPAWYRRTIDCSDRRSTDRVLIRFGAAGQRAKVYVGQRLVAEHTGGYDAFTVDLTDALAEHEEGLDSVPLLVRCDNSRDLEQPPSDLSDFTLYGGLHRPVEMQIAPEVSLRRVEITTDIDDDAATVRLNALLRNPAPASGPARLEVVVTAPDGETVASESVDIEDLAEASTTPVTLSLDRAQRWSPSAPALYGYSVTLIRGDDRHTLAGRIGFRTFRFEEHGPFFLNGERLLLRGTHRHEDHAGYGAAVPEGVLRQEFQMIKEMGANFIRLGHYQQSDRVLELCDELGLLVWEEIPWCRGGIGGEAYQQTARRMLTSMIEQHRNHPSVILWGLGNENDWPGDFEGFDKKEIRAFMEELHGLAKRLDPGRLTSIRRCDFCKDVVDVYSPSIWAGWYRGRYTDYRSVTRREMEGVKHFFHAEWGASQHAGRHSETPDLGIEAVASGQADEREGDFLQKGGAARVSKDGDWSETYACNLIDWHLKEQENMPWLTGAAYWAFKDFATPLRPENPIPYVNQKGVVQRDLTPKESYHVFRSYWSETPMVHLYGSTWPTRWGAEGEEKLIKVYSNCESVELFLNGESCGVKHRDSQDFPAAGLRWRVALMAGDNDLRAVARDGDARLEDSYRVAYQTEPWGPADRVALEVIDESGDAATVRATARDASGLVCLDAKNRVRFSLAGDGRLVDDLGTAGGSRVVELANGVAQITIRKGAGRSTLGVSADGIASGFLEIDAHSPEASDVAAKPGDAAKRPQPR